MLTETLNNLSNFLSIDTAIIPNIITLIVMTTAIFIALKGQAPLLSIVALYAIMSLILSLLGIESVFNLFDIVGVT